jgi:hypothetical protein
MSETAARTTTGAAPTVIAMGSQAPWAFAPAAVAMSASAQAASDSAMPASYVAEPASPLRADPPAGHGRQGYAGALIHAAGLGGRPGRSPPPVWPPLV